MQDYFFNIFLKLTEEAVQNGKRFEFWGLLKQ